jgi:hypothetical protein
MRRKRRVERVRMSVLTPLEKAVGTSDSGIGLQTEGIVEYSWLGIDL